MTNTSRERPRFINARLEPMDSDYLIDEIASKGIAGAVFDADAVLFKHNSPDTMYQDARVLIGQLGKKGIQFGVASNNPDKELARARARELDIPGNLYLTPDNILSIKPSPIMISKALAELGILSDSVIGFGDGMTDYIAFRMAGIEPSNIGLVVRPPEEALGYPFRREVRRAWQTALGVSSLTSTK